MTATRHDARIPAGDTYSFLINLTDEATGAVLDLTGATAHVVVWRGATEVLTDTLAASGSGDGMLTVVGLRTAGQLRVLLTAAVTAALAGTYEHETKVKLADGRVDQVVIGTYDVTASQIGADV